MNCKGDGATHFGCDCVMAQLQAADALAKTLKGTDYLMRHHSYCGVFDEKECNCSIRNLKDALAAYEKVRGTK